MDGPHERRGRLRGRRSYLRLPARTGRVCGGWSGPQVVAKWPGTGLFRVPPRGVPALRRAGKCVRVLERTRQHRQHPRLHHRFLLQREFRSVANKRNGRGLCALPEWQCVRHDQSLGLRSGVCDERGLRRSDRRGSLQYRLHQLHQRHDQRARTGSIQRGLREKTELAWHLSVRLGALARVQVGRLRVRSLIAYWNTGRAEGNGLATPAGCAERPTVGYSAQQPRMETLNSTPGAKQVHVEAGS
jgi:hypothetical protein